MENGKVRGAATAAQILGGSLERWQQINQRIEPGEDRNDPATREKLSLQEKNVLIWEAQRAGAVYAHGGDV